MSSSAIFLLIIVLLEYFIHFFKIPIALVAGINGGTGFAQELRETKPLNVYHVKAQLGLLTDTSFIDGKPRYKCNYEFITRDAIDRVVAGAQATHQKLLLR